MIKKRYHKYFGGFIKPHEHWLNKMGAKGYRLIKTGISYYDFEYNPDIPIEYKVVYIGHKSYKNAQLFKQEQEKLGYTAFYKNINLNYAKGKKTYRPWAEKGGKVVTDKTTLNKELLIIYKVADDNPIATNISNKEILTYTRSYRNYILILSIINFLTYLYMNSQVFKVFSIILFISSLLETIKIIYLKYKLRRN